MERIYNKLVRDKIPQIIESKNETPIIKILNDEEYKLYADVEKISQQLLQQRGKSKKEVSANVDFYSGFVYNMLGLPIELYTPMFAISRISGWSAHRIEELINNGKIIRPAYKSIMEEVE